MPDRGQLMNPKLMILVLKLAIALVEAAAYLYARFSHPSSDSHES